MNKRVHAGNHFSWCQHWTRFFVHMMKDGLTVLCMTDDDSCLPSPAAPTEHAKTRDTYVAYRKAGYSKKFLAEHESEITIHKAAKNYFDGLGFKKLPTIKALNTEYAELLAEKKAAYADYRKAREEMKELLTAKANIDRILELDKEQEEANERREKEAEQR